MKTWCAKSASRKSLKGLGVFPLSNDRFINGPTHGPAGRYFFSLAAFIPRCHACSVN